MKYQRKIVLFFVLVAVFTLFRTNFVYEGKNAVNNNIYASEVDTLPQSEAVLTGYTATYVESRDSVILNFGGYGCAYVNIYANGIELETEYTGTAYEYFDITEGVTYEFTIRPYDVNGIAGPDAVFSYTVPYARAVVDYVDADYNLEKSVLVLDWAGDSIYTADVYQDGILIGSRVSGDRLIIEIPLAPLSTHTYVVIPYNPAGEVGTQSSCVLEVDDYVARIDIADIEYNETLKQIEMKWEDVYTYYVTIYLNDVVLVENYTQKQFVFPCELQPGATYMVSIEPYNYKNEDGEILDEDVSIGYFEVPDTPMATVVSLDYKTKAGLYTGFDKPGVKVEWEAQGQAIYEIYRGKRNSASAYTWVATVKPEKEGLYTYIDDNVEIGNYYYKIRRKIQEDEYIEQELFTSLSDFDNVRVSLPRPELKVSLTDDNQATLVMSTTKKYVSGYDIYRKSGNGGFKKIATVTEDYFIDDTVEFGTSYYYMVKSFYYNEATGKKTIGKASKVTKIKNTIGSMTAELKSVSADTVQLSWTPAANATEYEVYYRSSAQGDSYVLWTTTENLSITRKLVKTGTHFFMVKALKTAEGEKNYFSSVEVSCKMGFGAPTGFEVSKTSYKWNSATQSLAQNVTLSWNRVYGAKGYYIDVYDTAKKKYKRLAKVKKSSTTSYVVSNPVTLDSEEVTYRISAYAGSSTKKGQTIVIKPNIGIPKKVKAVKSGSKVKITWNKVAGAESYNVYRSNGRTMFLVGETKTTSIIDKGLSVGVNYDYYVQAKNATLNLEGECSLPAVFKMEQKKVSKLTAVTTKEGKIQLSWKAAKGATNYLIYYSTTELGEYKNIAELSGAATTFLHENIAEDSMGVANTTNTTSENAGQNVGYYKVVAAQKNSGGILVESVPVSVTAANNE